MDEHVCHIWQGLFGPGAPEDYFVQEFVDGETHPSRFGAEQGTSDTFDYDFVEISFLEAPQPVLDLVDGHSYCGAYLEEVVRLAAEAGIREINVFVLANRDEFESPRSASGPDYKLWYLGEFACRE